MSFIYCGFGGADARKVYVSADYFLSGEMTASFGEDLVFDVKAGNVGPDVLLDCQGNSIWPCIYVSKDEGSIGC